MKASLWDSTYSCAAVTVSNKPSVHCEIQHYCGIGNEARVVCRLYVTVATGDYCTDMRIDLTPDQMRELADMLIRRAPLVEALQHTAETLAA